MLKSDKELIVRGSEEALKEIKQRGWIRGCERDAWHKVRLTECEIVRDGDTYILFGRSRCWCGAKYMQY